MTVDLERRLHDELAGLAATTRTAPDALDRIVERAARVRRRRRVPLVVATALGAVLVVVAVATTRDPRAGRVTAQVPPGPPALTGTVIVAIDTNPCAGNCFTGHGRFDVAQPDVLEVLERDGAWTTTPEYGHEGPDVLPDGRRLEEDDGGTTVVVDPETGDEQVLGSFTVQSADVLADGRIVVVARDTTTHASRVAVVDAGGGGLTDYVLPDGVTANAVAAGPDGAFAVLADARGECCLNRPVLLVADADGTSHVHDLSDALGIRRIPLIGEPTMSWGPSGLLAVSSDLPEPYIAGSPAGGWVVVVDPATGDRVAAIDGWQGVAWSPDGRGLLTARHVSPRVSQLAVRWGPGFDERVDVGATPLPVVPRSWLP